MDPVKFDRRQFISKSALGFGSIALQSLLCQEAHAKPGAGFGLPHLPAKAKNVIWLFMRGGVSHMESFDPKPHLNRYAGKTISETPFHEVQASERLKKVRVGTFGGYFVKLKKISDDPENGHENEEMKRRSGKFTFFSKMS